jgi:predicted  nucleic acid-binding Zn-ribbon protein
MSNNNSDDFTVRIDSLGKQKDSSLKELNKINESLSKENETLDQFKKDRELAQSKMKAIGFFKFQERKPFKDEIKGIDSKIIELENKIKEIDSKKEDLSNQISGFENEIQNLKEEKLEHEKELALINKANTGDSNAQYEIGRKLINRDYKQALSWLNKAIAQGHNGAKSFLKENRKEFYFFLLNDTAFYIVEVSVYLDGNIIFPPTSVSIPPTNEGGYNNCLLFSVPQEHCEFNKKRNEYCINIRVDFKCQTHGGILPVTQKENLYRYGHQLMTEKEVHENFEENKYRGSQFNIYAQFMQFMQLRSGL